MVEIKKDVSGRRVILTKAKGKKEQGIGEGILALQVTSSLRQRGEQRCYKDRQG